MLGQALVATGDRDRRGDPGALEGDEREPESPEAFQYLAMAYGRKGNIGQAELASAQAFMNAGDFKNAQTQASRAMAKLPPGSPGYLQGRGHPELIDRPG